MTRVFRVEVPLTSLRPFTARDFQETLPVAPPSTVVGMLLSLLGCEPRDLADFGETRIAISIQGHPERSVVLRKMRRDPANPKRHQRGIPQFRPEYQEVLAGVVLYLAVMGRMGEAISRAIAHPEQLDRYGAVSLGESCFLVDAIVEVDAVPEDVRVLRPDPRGDLALPVRVDFRDRGKTAFRRFRLVRGPLTGADFVDVGA